MAQWLLALLVCFSLAIAQVQGAGAPGPESDDDCEGLVDVADGAGLSTLLSAVQAANLTDALVNPEDKLTVFAPTEEAFLAAFEALDLDAVTLLADVPTLTQILRYHVVPAAALSTDLSDGQTLTTLLGDDSTCGVGDVTVDLSDGVKIVGGETTATVVMADIETCSAIVHVIDAVLLPCPL